MLQPYNIKHYDAMRLTSMAFGHIHSQALGCSFYPSITGVCYTGYNNSENVLIMIH